MNTVWKDLDSIFKSTLRKYVRTNQRDSFDVYAKAVGFNPGHTGLLYLTLKLEQDQFDSETGGSVATNSDIAARSPRKRSHSEIVCVDDQEDEKASQPTTLPAIIDVTVTALQPKTQPQPQALHHQQPNIEGSVHYRENAQSHPSLERSPKRRKTVKKKVKSRKHRHSGKRDVEQPCITGLTASMLLSDRKKGSSSKKTKTKKKKKDAHDKIQSRVFSSKITSPLPIYNIYGNVLSARRAASLYGRPVPARSQNNEYQKLKALTSQFKTKKLSSSVVQSNQQKIGKLLANCSAYKKSLIAKGNQTKASSGSKRTNDLYRRLCL